MEEVATVGRGGGQKPEEAGRRMQNQDPESLPVRGELRKGPSSPAHPRTAAQHYPLRGWFAQCEPSSPAWRSRTGEGGG